MSETLNPKPEAIPKPYTLRTLWWLPQFSGDLTVYCDSKAVVALANNFLAGHRTSFARVTHPDSDLGSAFQRVIANRSGELKIQWVKAHRDIHQALSWIDAWGIPHNQMADHWAREAAKLSPASALQAFLSFRATRYVFLLPRLLSWVFFVLYGMLFSSFLLSHTPSASAGGSQTLDRPA